MKHERDCIVISKLPIMTSVEPISSRSYFVLNLLRASFFCNKLGSPNFLFHKNFNSVL